MNPLVEVKNLKAGYGNKVILKDVSMLVQPKEIRVVLGGSGCGKSTLLKNIIGLEIPQEGEINILGQRVRWGEEQLASEFMQKIGVLFQNSALLTSLTVGENVGLPIRIHHPQLPQSVIEEIVLSKLGRVGLAHAFDLMPNELSGGMRKRAGLARAIATDPQLLFCDEPSAGLDPVSSQALDELLMELRDSLSISIVIVTHELDSIRTLCDRLTFLSGGYVVFDGTLQEAEAQGPQEVRNFLSRKAEEDQSKASNVQFNLED